MKLHPLTKLKGGVDQDCSSLPNLAATTIDYSDDLVLAVDDLLHPEEIELKNTPAWQSSRLRICAVALIIERLHELETPDLVSVSLGSLQAHFD